MDFGLGLILSLTDNASFGIQQAVNNLTQLTSTAQDVSSSFNTLAVSQLALQMGDGMANSGARVLSTYGQIIGKVNQVGQTIGYATNAFNTLYQDSDKTGKQVVADIQDYAAKSVFAFEDLLPVVQMLKANGIEAFDSITTSSGKTTQTLMDYASDLAAFNPQMHNAYGTGVQAAMGSINEYIAEGNKVSLKRNASLDINQILGEATGKTIEERSRQVADLMEKLKMVGMTASMAGSPMQLLSNMSDRLFILLGKISDSGVYDMFASMLTDLALTLESLPLDKIADTIGGALTDLLQPVKAIEKALLPLLKTFANFVATHPKIAKFAILAVALSGALLVLGGTALKLMGSLGYLSFMLSHFSGSFGIISSTLTGGIAKIVGALIPLALAIGLVALAWKNDLFRIRTNVTGFVQNVSNSFGTAKSAVNGSLEDMKTVLAGFDTKNNFFDGLTLAMMRVMVVARALSEGWNSFELSEDTFDKANELGVLPLIESLFDLKYRFDNFVEGFAEGWSKATSDLNDFVDNLKVKLDGTVFEDIINSVTDFFSLFSGSGAEDWKNFGSSVGEVSLRLLALVVAVNGAHAVFGLLAKVVSVVVIPFKVLSSVATFLGKAFGFLTRVFSTVGRVLGFVGAKLLAFAQLVKSVGITQALQSTIGVVQTVFAGIAAVVGGVVLAVVNFVSQWKSGFDVVKAILMTVGVAIAAVGAIILGAPALIAGVIAGIIAVVANLAIVVHDHWNEIVAFIVGVATNIWQTIVNAFSAVVNAVATFLGQARDVAVEVWNNILETVSTVLGVILGVVQTVWTNISNAVSTAIGVVKSYVAAGWNAVKVTISGVLSGISSNVSNGFNAIKSTVSSVLSSVGNTVSNVFNGIKNTVSNVIGNAKSVVQDGVNAIKRIFGGLSLKFPEIKLPHFTVTGSFSLTPPKVPKFSVSWYKNGGVFNKPSIIGVGEAGDEAVMPLKKNTEWIGSLASTLSNKINNIGGRIKASKAVTYDTTTTQRNSYMTSTDTSTHNSYENNKNTSVVFNQGAIQIVSNGTSDEEAKRLAVKIMEYIKREGELDEMRTYNS